MKKQLMEFWKDTLECNYCDKYHIEKRQHPQFRPVGKDYQSGRVKKVTDLFIERQVGSQVKFQDTLDPSSKGLLLKSLPHGLTDLLLALPQQSYFVFVQHPRF
jgi:hypothetical protein